MTIRGTPLFHGLFLIAGIMLILFAFSSGCLSGTSNISPSATTADVPAGSGSSPTGQATLSQGAGTSALSCSHGQVTCGSSCVNTASDAANCGRCGYACPSNAQCKESLCYCNDGYGWSDKDQRCEPDTVPTAGQTQGSTGGSGSVWTCENPSLTACPDHYCYDLSNDPSHCGSCDNTCATGQDCVSGKCTGGSGTSMVTSQSACNGQPVDLQTDNVNCGSCGNVCDPCMPCQQGTCQYKVGTCDYCTAASDCVGTRYPTTDFTLNHYAWVCAKLPSNAFKTCYVDCAASYTNCHQASFIPTCYNLQTDPGNCGSCGKTCSGSCVNGACKAAMSVVTQSSNAIVRQVMPSWGGSWTGHITYDFDMSLTVNTDSSVTGTYASGQGTLKGILSSDGSVINCQASWKGGNPMSCQFTMNADGKSFTGYYTDSSGAHSWTGHR